MREGGKKNKHHETLNTGRGGQQRGQVTTSTTRTSSLQAGTRLCPKSAAKPLLELGSAPAVGLAGGARGAPCAGCTSWPNFGLERRFSSVELGGSSWEHLCGSVSRCLSHTSIYYTRAGARHPRDKNQARNQGANAWLLAARELPKTGKERRRRAPLSLPSRVGLCEVLKARKKLFLGARGAPRVSS